MIPGQDEVPADKKAIPAAIQRADATIPTVRKDRQGVNRRQAQVACQTEGPATRQQEAIARR